MCLLIEVRIGLEKKNIHIIGHYIALIIVLQNLFKVTCMSLYYYECLQKWILVKKQTFFLHNDQSRHSKKFEHAKHQ